MSSMGVQGGQDAYNMGMSQSNQNTDDYKTLPCESYANTGRCPNGMNCRFAHSAAELRSPAGSSTKSVLCKTWLEDGNCRDFNCNFAHGQKELLKNTEMPCESLKLDVCPVFRENGHCPFGERCNFSHRIQKRSFESMAMPKSEPVLDGKYKVVLCDKGVEKCPMKDKCHYAHGYEELHFYRLKQVPNYKKAICRSWEETKSCQWEKTCMFAHGVYELRAEDSGAGSGNAMYFNQNKDLTHQQGYPQKRMKY